MERVIEEWKDFQFKPLFETLFFYVLPAFWDFISDNLLGWEYLLGSNYIYQTNQKTNIKFSGKALMMSQQFRAYIDLPDFEERYEVEFPIMSLHNFIIGTPYIDIGETMTIHKAGS